MTRVLVVDDKEENLYYLNALLSPHGCEVESARHGAEALVRARRAPPEVIISDLLMPVMDGYTLLRHWKADPRLREVPFIVYTATYTEAADEQLALDLGADAFILKPAEPAVFLARLREVLATVTAAVPKGTQRPAGDEKELLRGYSETLIRKLEEKSLLLEESNRTLQLDIAARERAESALREALAARDRAEREAAERAAVLNALFASVPDVVIHVDLEGTIRLINRERLRSDGAGMLGSSWLSSGPPEQREIMQRAFDTVTTKGKATSFESATSGQGEPASAFWTTIGPVIREGRIAGAVVVSRDITERRRTEAQLIVSDRMASVGTLAAGVAHEINNPLASVMANLALADAELVKLARLYPVPTDLLDELRDARDGAERVRLIVRDLKIFSRADETKLGPVDVEQVMESTLRMAWNELRHRARLRKNYGKVPPVSANESRLGQVLLNLLVNAAQAIPEGNCERNEVSVETHVDPGTRQVVISISDTGAGIPLEVQRRLFTPFFTTKPAGVGTGLGLSICHRIVTTMGGAIDFSSEVGLGTNFRVSLPVADLVGPSEVAPPANPMAPGRRGSVLVIDDDPAIIHSVKRLLASEHDVQAVQSAAKAMELFIAGKRFDVVLCDLMMPQVTGMELYHQLAKLDLEQAARVVFMTGGAFTPAARAFLDDARNQRIEKPFEIQGLRALVNGLTQ